MIGTLKAAFVHGRLTADELSARVDRVVASRTYAELAEVTADIPTALTGAESPRDPWRATKIAWWFEYATFLPGIVAVLLLPGGPHTTLGDLVILAAVVYLVFWTLGVFMMVSSRRVKPSSGATAAALHRALAGEVLASWSAPSNVGGPGGDRPGDEITKR